MKYKKILSVLLGMLIITGIGKIFIFSMPDDDKAHQQEFLDKYYIFALSTPKSLLFAGEKVPLEQFDVRERLDRELLLNTYWQSQTLLFHKRANRWFPVIVPILKRNGIPEDFKYLALAESGFLHNSSPVGATGYWQFMDATAKTYGLEINEEIDERFHPEKSTEAACRYLKDAYKSLGSWSMVAASYNMGMAGVRKQIEKQRVGSYYDLLLNEETSRYLFRVLALKEIISSPVKYGYHFKKKDLYSPYAYKVVKVDSSISDLTSFALGQGINYKILKILNPWLRQNTLTNKEHKSFDIKILLPGYTGMDDNGDNMLGSDTLLAILPPTTLATSPIEDKVTAVDGGNVVKEPLKCPPVQPKQTTYVVKSGDVLGKIARKFEVDMDDILKWNKMKKPIVKKGQKLIINLPEKPAE